MDFKHLTRGVEVKPENTREYTFAQLEGEPSVIVAPAADVNPAFLDARLRLTIEQGEAMAAKPRGRAQNKPTVEELRRNLDEGRELDKRLLSGACLRGWGTAPVDPKGKEVEFTVENGLDFLKALPDFVFDPFNNFASNVYNFTAAAIADAEKLGNS